jgi:hypothetical protein
MKRFFLNVQPRLSFAKANGDFAIDAVKLHTALYRIGRNLDASSCPTIKVLGVITLKKKKEMIA